MLAISKRDLQFIGFSIIWTPIIKLWKNIIEAEQKTNVTFGDNSYIFYFNWDLLNIREVSDLKTIISSFTPN